MLKLHLTPIFRARGIEKPYTFLVKAGFSPFTASNLLNEKTKAIRLDHIERLCKALLCEPNDLMAWTLDKNEVYADNLPLHKLRPSEPVNQNWQQTLAAMPLEQLKAVIKNITGPETE